MISSDAPGYYYDATYYDPIFHTTGGYMLWGGTLQIPWDDWERGQGTLSARGYDKRSNNYEGSCLPAAGRPPDAQVWYRERLAGVGFDVIVDWFSGAGNWFIFDYHAERVGTCHVELYDQPSNFAVPAQTLNFNHVPSRDFNGDTIVDFQDLALLASCWASTVPADANSPARGFDLDTDGCIDLADLSLFSEYWLERTDCSRPVADPNGTPLSP